MKECELINGGHTFALFAVILATYFGKLFGLFGGDVFKTPARHILNASVNALPKRFCNRTGTSVDDGARKSNNWLDQWQSGKLSTGSRV